MTFLKDHAMKTVLLFALFFLPLAGRAQTRAQIAGCWKMSAIKGEKLFLKSDGSFSFDDYNALSKQTENFYGTWKLVHNKVTLMYDDRPQQNFTIRKDKKGNWILRKEGGFLFVKAAAGDCGS